MLLLSVIAREFRESAHKRRLHWLRFLFGGGMGVWFCIVALKSSLVGGEALGQAVYTAVMVPLACGVMLLAPTLASAVIARERNEDTLGLLFLTHLRAPHVVLAKFAARFVEMLWFILLAMPLLAVSICFGGISWTDLIGATLILLALLLFGTALGVCVSAFFQTVWVASVSTMLLMLALDRCAALFCGEPGLEPGAALVKSWQIVVDSKNLSPIVWGAWDLILAVAFAIPMLMVAIWRVRCVSKSPGTAPPSSLWKRMRARIESANPYVGWAALGILLLAALNLFPLIDKHTGIEYWSYWLGWIANAVLLMYVAQSIADEKDSRTLEVLVCTPISNADLIKRTLVKAWRLCWGWYLLLHSAKLIWLIQYLVYGETSDNLVARLFALVFVLAPDIIYDLGVIVSVGCFFSCRARTTALAIGASVTIGGLALAAPYVVFGQMDIALLPFCLVPFMWLYSKLLENFRIYAAQS